MLSSDGLPRRLTIPGGVTETELQRLLEAPAAALGRGELVAFPTETVYGLGAGAHSAAAIGRVYEVKGRDGAKPLLFHVATLAAARALTSDWSETAECLAARFLPGPLTLILPAAPQLDGHPALAGQGSVGIRIPRQRTALALIGQAGVPVCAPSANLSGRPSPTRAADVIADLGARVDWVVDDGPTAVGLESTVLDLASGPLPRILRPGAVSAEDIAAALIACADPLTKQPGWREQLEGQGGSELRPRSYAPRTPVWLFASTELRTDTGLLQFCDILREAGIRRAAWYLSDETRARIDVSGARLGPALPAAIWPGSQLVYGPRGDHEAAARQLYACLRDLDRECPDVILVESDGETAYRDRLEHAAVGRIVGGRLVFVDADSDKGGPR
ncbi:MAG: L-threonylcarbamoyladenylate synthase [Bacillota bacterium]|nr:L-threonylcarbamoyladenylate synthase [Bacillota bacterium]